MPPGFVGTPSEDKKRKCCIAFGLNSLPFCQRRLIARTIRQGDVAKASFEKAIAMAEGTVKKVTDKGFGFITTADGGDIFFHMSNLDGVRFEDLREGQRVTYTVGQGPKGARAENVRQA